MIAKLRRSPLLMAAVALVVIIALAFGWWTVSPLFIRTSLAEGQNIAVPAGETDMAASDAAPTGVIAVSPQSTTAAPTKEAVAEPTVVVSEEPATAVSLPTEVSTTDEVQPSSEAMDKPTEQAEMTGPTVFAVGNFDRKDDVHYASGQAIIVRQEDGSVIVRLQDLDAANGPDLYVYVSEHPDPKNSAELHTGDHNLGTLKATNGSFNYILDPSIDPTKIKSVVIYCRAFSVIFSTATLQAQ